MTDPVTFFREAVPAEWFTGPVDVTFDRDEILVAGELAPTVDPAEFRERSRPHRVRIADQAEARFLRKVSWAIRQNDCEVRFTTMSVPVMSRLRIDERTVLDSLIEGSSAFPRGVVKLQQASHVIRCDRPAERAMREVLCDLTGARGLFVFSRP